MEFEPQAKELDRNEIRKFGRRLTSFAQKTEEKRQTDVEFEQTKLNLIEWLETKQGEALPIKGRYSCVSINYPRENRGEIKNHWRRLRVGRITEDYKPAELDPGYWTIVGMLEERLVVTNEQMAETKRFHLNLGSISIVSHMEIEIAERARTS